jgi:ribosome-binding ATPase
VANANLKSLYVNFEVLSNNIMGLSVGIVGLTNVGKSTLFNALLKKQLAYVANFPFATIEPNIGVVPVPDSRLDELAEVQSAEDKGNKKPPIVPSTVEFLDIAGLIAGAHKGEGLGNKFLSHIREVNAICHVIRAFTNEDIVRQGVTNPKSDFEVVETELKLADLQTLEKQKDPGNTPNKELRSRFDFVQRLKTNLEKGIPARDVEVSEEEKKTLKELSLLTAKPIMIVINIDESELKNADQIEEKYANELGVTKEQVVAMCAKTENELSDLTEDEQLLYLNDLGIVKTPLERLIRKAFATLGLISFLTAGEIEVRAWTLKEGSTAQEASGEIHTDFIKKFIKADICAYRDFVDFGGWKQARENGKVRSEGKEYIVKDGDVVEFKVGT